MNTLRHSILLAALTLLFAASAQAEHGHPRGPEDFDGDGNVSRAEFDQWADSVFEKLDANDDQVISEDERPLRRLRHRRGGAPAGLAGRAFVHAADEDGDGDVENGEWQVFLSGLETDADGGLTEASLQELLPRRHAHHGDEAVAEGSGDRRIRFAGRLFDTDDDGSVTIAELNDLFTSFDANGDGTLAADEVPSFRRGGPRGGRQGSRGGRGGFSP